MFDDLHKEMIIDHAKDPSNGTLPKGANSSGFVHNEMCGDKVQVDLEVRGGVIVDIGFKGTGCAISLAASSVMKEAVKGKSIDEAIDLFRAYSKMISGDDYEPDDLGSLAIFSGISGFPTRWKCVTLGWEALWKATEVAR